MLRNVFLKTLSDHLWAMVAWGFGMGLLLLFTAGQYPELLSMGGGTVQQRLEDAARMTRAFAIASGEVVAIDSVGGYVTSRALGPEAMMLGLWALILGVGLVRGEEGTGALDVLLSSPKSRLWVLAQKMGAAAFIVVVTCGLSFLGLWAGYAVAGAEMPVVEAALSQLNVAAMVIFWCAMGLLAGQIFSPRRRASATGGTFLFATYVLNNIFETNSNLEEFEWYTPWHLFSLSKPLAPGYGMDWLAWSALAGMSLAGVLFSAVLFARRDLGMGLSLRWKGRSTVVQEPARVGLLGSLFGKHLRDLAAPTLAWGLGLAAGGALFAGSINEALEPLAKMSGGENNWIVKMLGSMTGVEAFLQNTIIIYLEIFLVIFAIMQVGGWVSDEEEGRLEIQVSMPVARWRVAVARYAAMAISIVVMLAFTAAGIFAATTLTGVSADAGRISLALLATLPVAMVVAAFGICLATFLPNSGAAMPITVGLVVVMFFLNVLGPIWDVPESILDLSVFHLYGRPASEGLQWEGITALITGTLLFAIASLVALRRRDITR